MFESTLPFGAPELMRASEFRRAIDAFQAAQPKERESTRMSSLSPSLLQDLMRFEPGDGSGELLEVMAASRRHGRALLIHLELGAHAIPLTVFPVEQLAHCPLPPEQLLAARLDQLRVMHIEPALLRAPGSRVLALVADARQYLPLALLCWELALRGSRHSLLPELAGSAAYRVTPAADLQALNLSGSLAVGVDRLRRETTNLREMAEWPGFDRERAIRLLNALYLQAALRISRTHPAATNEGWRTPRA